MARVWVAAALTALIGLTGCGGGGVKQAPLDEVRRTDLTELGDLLKTLAAEGKRPPAKPADLAELEPFMPTAAASLRSGEIVYLWGSGHAAGGTAVVAHEKKAPTDGGLVLLQDGSIKTLTADEFKAAPKAQ